MHVHIPRCCNVSSFIKMHLDDVCFYIVYQQYKFLYEYMSRQIWMFIHNHTENK